MSELSDVCRQVLKLGERNGMTVERQIPGSSNLPYEPDYNVYLDKAEEKLRNS